MVEEGRVQEDRVDPRRGVDHALAGGRGSRDRHRTIMSENIGKCADPLMNPPE
jgi:hypothetical protein